MEPLESIASVSPCAIVTESLPPVISTQTSQAVAFCEAFTPSSSAETKMA